MPKSKSDLNSDNIINILDVVLIINMILNLQKYFFDLYLINNEYIL